MLETGSVQGATGLIASIGAMGISPILFFGFNALILFGIAFLIIRTIRTKKQINSFGEYFLEAVSGDLRNQFEIIDVKCYDVMKCNKPECPVFDVGKNLCWFKVGSYAPRFHREIHCPAILSEKFKDCTECKVYKKMNPDHVHEMKMYFNEFMDTMGEFISHTQGSIKDVVERANFLSTCANELTSFSQNQKSNLGKALGTLNNFHSAFQNIEDHSNNQGQYAESTLTDMEMLTSAIRQIADGNNEVDHLAQDFNSSAASGKEQITQAMEQVKKVNEIMHKISKQISEVQGYSKNIDKIIDVIRDISEKTNMLAMNASIEAAHVGEAGKGFAIVAGEVRELSNSTADAILNIEKMVSQIKEGLSESVLVVEEGQNAAELGNQLAKKSEEALDTIANGISSISAMASQISGVTSLQTDSAKNVLKKSSDLKDLAFNIKNVINEQGSEAQRAVTIVAEASDAASENEKISCNLSELAMGLLTETDRLQDEVSYFRVQ